VRLAIGDIELVAGLSTCDDKLGLFLIFKFFFLLLSIAVLRFVCKMTPIPAMDNAKQQQQQPWSDFRSSKSFIVIVVSIAIFAVCVWLLFLDECH
jgi:hypothetical protein